MYPKVYRLNPAQARPKPSTIAALRMTVDVHTLKGSHRGAVEFIASKDIRVYFGRQPGYCGERVEMIDVRDC